MESPTLIGAGMIVDLFFTLPGENAPVIVKGRVVWSNVKGQQDTDNSLNAVLGIEFLNMCDADRNRLSGFLHNGDNQA